MNNSVFLRPASFDEIEINRKEALRYLGYTAELPAGTDRLFDVAENEIKKHISLRACWAKTAVTVNEDNEVDLGFCKIKSKDLAKNLGGCRSAFVFAATTGTGIDRLIMKYQKIEPSKAVVIDALSSAAVEGLCNLLNGELKQGRKTVPRYSPGYGDVSLEYQKDILSFLDAQRKIGITLCESLFMTPVKSVTAIIGVMEEEE